MEDEYMFVTLDNDMVTTGDAVFVDIDDAANGMDMDFVQIDDSYVDMDVHVDGAAYDSSDFITMDDMNMMDNSDIDSYSSDINEADVSVVV